MKEGYSNWRKLDNAALAFPLVTGKNDTRVFRFYCELKENVKPELLQAALEKTMEKYPLFQMVLRKGLFWFYLDQTVSLFTRFQRKVNFLRLRSLFKYLACYISRKILLHKLLERV